LPPVKLTLAFAVALACLAVAADTLRGRVVRVADGDTITVLGASNVQHKVCLDKIDAPEKKQAFGEKSKQHLSEMVFGKDVKVEWQKKDRYGRILGEVYVCSTNANLQMVKDGMAWHYKLYDKTEVYAAAEKDARDKRIGLWSDPNPIEPHEFRKSKRGDTK